MNAPIDLRDVVLHTPRLTLRPWRLSDLDDFYAYAREDGVGQMAGWLPHKNREETRKILDLFIGQHKTFALEYQGGVVGSLGVECYDKVEKLDFLMAGHFERNTRSARVIEKCGFIYCKTLPYETQYNTVETSVESILWNPAAKVK